MPKNYFIQNFKLPKKDILPQSEAVCAMRKDTHFTIYPLALKYAQYYAMDEKKVYDVFFKNYEAFILNFAHLVGKIYATEQETEIHIFENMPIEKALIDNADSACITLNLDPSLNHYKNLINLGASRHYKPFGLTLIGVKNRPGYPELDKQILPLQNKEIVLLEDDIYSGATLNAILGILKENNIKIKKIAVGIQMGQCKITDYPIESVVNYLPSACHLDLADPRDYLLSASGLVVEQGENLVRLPFILPFISPAERLGIPKPQENTFSMQLYALNLEFFENIEKELGHPFLLAFGEEFAIQGFQNILPNLNSNTTLIKLIDYILNNFENLLEKMGGK